MESKCCEQKSNRKCLDKLQLFLQTIADPSRLKILCALQAGPMCVCEIFPAVGISDKLASHHLKQLKNAGLLIEKREGNFIYYRLDRNALKDNKKIFNQVIK